MMFSLSSLTYNQNIFVFRFLSCFFFLSIRAISIHCIIDNNSKRWSQTVVARLKTQFRRHENRNSKKKEGQTDGFRFFGGVRMN